MSEKKLTYHRTSKGSPKGKELEGIRPGRRSRSLVVTSSEVIVYGLTSDVNIEEFMKILADCGEIITFQLKEPSGKKDNSVTAVIKFSSASEARHAIEKLTGIKFEGVQLTAKFNTTIERDIRASAQIVVERIPCALSLEYVKGIFERFGDIEKAEVQKINSTNTFWKALIQYNSIENASQAVYSMNNSEIEKSKKPIHVHFYSRPEQLPEQTTKLHRTLQAGSLRSRMNGQNVFDLFTQTI